MMTSIVSYSRVSLYTNTFVYYENVNFNEPYFVIKDVIIWDNFNFENNWLKFSCSI